MTRHVVLSVQLIAAFVVFSVTPDRSSAHDQDYSRRYSFEIELYSYNPELGIASYQRIGSGSGIGNASVSMGGVGKRLFSVVVESAFRSGQYVATVRVEPKEDDSVTVATQREFILSNLEPQTLEIARNDDGRVYRLQIIPKIVAPQKPTRISVADLKLDQWSFLDSIVLLNDQDYVGRIVARGGPMASIDLAGVAKVDFSLIPFRDAAPDGVLKDGVVTLRRSDGTSIQIANVAIGVPGSQLSVGPYEVFVLWSEPSLTLAQYRERLEKSIAQLREKIAIDDSPHREQYLERLEKALQSDRVMMFDSSVGSIPE